MSTTAHQCPIEDCPSALELPLSLTDAEVGQRVREAGWFVSGDQLICHLHAP